MPLSPPLLTLNSLHPSLATAILLLRANEALGIVVNAVRRIVKAKEDVRFVRTLAKIVVNLIVREEIAAGRIKNALRVGFKYSWFRCGRVLVHFLFHLVFKLQCTELRAYNL
jgi:hypothetical protein